MRSAGFGKRGKTGEGTKTRAVILCWAGVALFATVIGPPRGVAQTLTDALIQAYQTNPTLEAQRAKLRSVDEGVSQALSNWRPTITFKTEYGRNRVDSESSGVVSRELRRPETYNLTVEQPIYRGGRTVAQTRRAENEVLAERARLKDTEQEILLDAATAYMDVVRDQAVVRLRKGNEEVLRRQLEATRDRFSVGEVTRTDVSQAEARLARAKADRIRAEGDLEVSRATYLRVIGTLPGRLETPKPVEGLPKTLDEALDLALRGFPSVVAAEFAAKAARDSVELVQGELLPTLSLTGELEKRYDTASAGSSLENLSIVATLKVPLYQQGAVFSRVREAKQVLGQRRLEIDEARRKATERAKTAWEELVSARARIEALRVEIRSNEIALEGVRQEALVGSRTVLDVLDAEQELLDAHVSLVRAQRDEFVAAMRLRAAIGTLTARDLALPVDYYNEVEHYNEVRNKPWGLGKDVSD